MANPGTSNGPSSVILSYDAGSGFTDVLTIASPAAAFTQHTFDFTGLPSTTGSTTFRLRASGANNDNPAGGLNYDNIAFTGCGSPQQPTLTKAFSPSAIAVNGTSTLTFTLTNPNSAVLTGAQFSDALPAGLQVSGAPSATTTCAGSPSWAPAPGSTSLVFGQATGATLAANASCTVSVNVTATTAGPHTNVSGFVSTVEGGTNSGAGGSASASLSAIVAPTMQKSFATNPIQTNGVSILTFTIANPNESDALDGIAFVDDYPGGLVNANPLSPPVANTCGGIVTASAGGSGITLSGGALAGGATCTVSVPVTAAAAGTYVNTSGPVSANTTGNGNAPSAGLTVALPHPAISLLKLVSASPGGPWLKFVSVPPATPLYYQFTAENTGDVALDPFNVADPALAGTGADPALCVWQTANSPSTLPALPVATATVDPTATCVVGPVVAGSGDHPNTASAHGTFNSVVFDSNATTADYIGALPGFSLLKQVGGASLGPWSSAIVIAAGGDVFYKFTLINTGALPLSAVTVTDPQVDTASCTFTDPLPVGGATTCIVGPIAASGAPGATTTNTATGHGTNAGSPFDTSPSSASYTISSLQSDLSIAVDDGATTVTAGGTTTYTITVANAGPDDVTDAPVIDAAPPGMTFGAWSCVVSNPGSGGSVTTACGAASGSGDINTTVTMKAGATITYTVPASIAPGASGSLANTATIAAPSGTTDPTPGNNSATDTDTVTPIVPVADLSITNDDGVTSLVAGGTTTYTVTVSNAGPDDVTDAVVVDAAPSGMTFGAWTCVVSNPGSGGSVTTACSTPSGTGDVNTTATMKSGGVITYTIAASVAPSASGNITNSANVSAPAGTTDPNPANNAASDTDDVTPATPVADLGVTISDGVVTVAAGGSTTYTITLTNGGADDVTAATLTDIAPVGVMFGTWTCAVTSPGSGGSVTTACGAASGSGNVNTVVTMQPGAVITFTVPASIAPGASGSVVNTATIAPPAGVTDPTPANNSATDIDTVTASAVPQADLAITNSDGVSSVSPGGTITYTITISNAGPDAVTNATVSDFAPGGVAFGTWTCVVGNPGSGGSVTTTCGAANGSGDINTVVTMKSGAVVTYTIAATVAPGASGSLVNTATVAVPVGVADPVPGNNSATDVDTVAVQGRAGARPIPTLDAWALATLLLLVAAFAIVARRATCRARD